MQIALSSAGMFAFSVAGGSMICCLTAALIAASSPPSNSGWWVSASHITTPSAQTSLRRSPSPPLICSGAAYAYAVGSARPSFTAPVAVSIETLAGVSGPIAFPAPAFC